MVLVIFVIREIDLREFFKTRIVFWFSVCGARHRFAAGPYKTSGTFFVRIADFDVISDDERSRDKSNAEPPFCNETFAVGVFNGFRRLAVADSRSRLSGRDIVRSSLIVSEEIADGAMTRFFQLALRQICAGRMTAVFRLRLDRNKRLCAVGRNPEADDNRLVPRIRFIERQ